jgi:hypothetical protein
MKHEWVEEDFTKDTSGNPEGKRPLGRPKRRYMDNIKIDLRGAGWCGINYGWYSSG